MHRLTAWIAEKGLSQAEAARRLDVTRSYLNQVIHGREPGSKLINRFEATVMRSVLESAHIEEGEVTYKVRNPSDQILLNISVRELLAILGAIMTNETLTPEERLLIAKPIYEATTRVKPKDPSS